MGSAVSTLMKPTPDAIVHALAEHARPIIREDYRVDSCIVSTLVGIEALRYFGIPAVPQSVKVRAFNRAMADHIIKGEVDDERTCAYWTPIDGSWGVGVGYGNGPLDRPGWDGHLVIRCDKFQAPVMIDLSIDQVNRPQHNIITKPFCALLPKGWPTPPDDMALIEFEQAVLHYTVHTNESYQDSEDWKLVDRARPVIGRVIRKLKEVLDKAGEPM
jgi:hypothetical protein